MEFFSSRRWRLHWPKQKAIVYMSNPKQLCSTRMASFHTSLTVGQIHCSSSSTKELHGLVDSSAPTILSSCGPRVRISSTTATRFQFSFIFYTKFVIILWKRMKKVKEVEVGTFFKSGSENNSVLFNLGDAQCDQIWRNFAILAKL